MSDGELFMALLGALAAALWLRRSIGKRASGKKIGIIAANATIAGVASAVLGAILIKFSRSSASEIPVVVLVIGGVVAMGIGLAVSLISAFKVLWAGINSPVELSEGAAGFPPVPMKEEKGSDSSDGASYLEYRLIENAQKEGNPNRFDDIESHDLFDPHRDCDLTFELRDEDDDR